MEKQRKYKAMSVIRMQLKSLRQQKRGYGIFLMFVNMLFGGMLPVIAVYIPMIIIDYLTAELPSDEIIRRIIIIAIALFIVSVVKAIADSFSSPCYLSARLREFNLADEKFLKIDYKYMEDAKFLDYYDNAISALNGDQMGFEGTLHNLYKIAPLILSTIVYSFIIGVFQPIVFIACVLGAIVTVLVNRKVTKYIMKRKDDQAHARRQRGYFYNVCYDFSYGKDVRVYGLDKKLSQDYKKRAYNYLTVIRDVANKRFGVGLFELIMLLLQDGLAYFFIIKGYFDNAISLGEVSLYVGAVIALSTTLRTISSLVTDINTSTGYTSDYYEFMLDDSYYMNKGTLTAVPNDETLAIEFKNVSFKYPNTEKYILKDFNFKIAKGEKLAIVGTNGAGKSTIVKLIAGLFDVNEGEILVNGRNVKEYSTEEYRKMFSAVFQDVNIFAATILKNVIGTDDSKEAIERGKDCLNRVGLKGKIESLPAKYDTPLLKVIDDKGVELSGGESQKIAIARALYKDGNMVILDEPTAALDALAEAEIYQSFDDLVKHKTSIYISHRLSSTKFCDKIALFTPDGLKEYGTHDELIKMEGEYYHMFKTQGKYYQEKVTEDE